MLLPALGKPTRATSAMSFSSRSSQRSSPTSPCSANDGARRRLDRKRALPRPPWPPRAASQRSPADDQVGQHAHRWRRGRPCLRARGPPGRRPAWPWRPLPMPWVPLPARRWGWSRKPKREATLRSATSQTSPPVAAVAAVGAALGHVRLPAERHRARRRRRPPSHGPGLRRRRRTSRCELGRPGGTRRQRGAQGRVSAVGEDVDQLAALAAGELHLAVREREQGVVAAAARRSPRGGSGCRAGAR